MPEMPDPRTASKAEMKFVLSTVIASIKAKHPAIEVEADGRKFVIQQPPLWPEAVHEVANDPRAVAKAILGDQYEAFIAAGGSTGILMEIIAEATGSNLGESSAS